MKQIYMFDQSGKFVPGENRISDADEVPFNATTVAPPELGAGYVAIWNGADWTICRAMPEPVAVE